MYCQTKRNTHCTKKKAAKGNPLKEGRKEKNEEGFLRFKCRILISVFFCARNSGNFRYLQKCGISLFRWEILHSEGHPTPFLYGVRHDLRGWSPVARPLIYTGGTQGQSMYKNVHWASKMECSGWHKCMMVSGQVECPFALQMCCSVAKSADRWTINRVFGEKKRLDRTRSQNREGEE